LRRRRVTLRLAGAARELDAEVDRRLVADAAAARFARIGAALPTLGLAEAKNLIGAPRLAVSAAFNGTRFATSDLLRLSALRTLEVQQASADAPFDHASVHGRFHQQPASAASVAGEPPAFA
jgi:hypothetical protein